MCARHCKSPAPDRWHLPPPLGEGWGGGGGGPCADGRRFLCRYGQGKSSMGLRSHMQRQAGMVLQVADDAEQIARLRIAGWAEHADQALG